MVNVREEVTRLKTELTDLQRTSRESDRQSKVALETKDRMVERLVAENDELKSEADRLRSANEQIKEELAEMREAHAALKEDHSIEQEATRRTRQAMDELSEKVCPTWYSSKPCSCAHS